MHAQNDLLWYLTYFDADLLSQTGPACLFEHFKMVLVLSGVNRCSL